MKKLKYIFMLLLSLVFIPRVYAFSYEFSVDAGERSVSAGTTKTVNVYIKNIKDANKGVLYCDFEVHAVGGLEFTGEVQSSSEWDMKNNGFYIFNAVNPITKDTKIFSVPIKVKSAGTLSIIDIKCYDGNTSVVSIADIYTKYTIAGSDSSSQQGNDKTTNNYLSDIKLSEGKIKFDPKVTEYTVKVSDYKNLLVEPVLAEANIRYSVIKEQTNGENVVYVNIITLDGNNIVYTIKVLEKDGEILSGNNSYIGIIFAVIVIIVLAFIIIKYKEKIMELIRKLKK